MCRSAYVSNAIGRKGRIGGKGRKEINHPAHPWSVACIASIPGLQLVAEAGSGDGIAAAFLVRHPVGPGDDRAFRSFHDHFLPPVERWMPLEAVQLLHAVLRQLPQHAVHVPFGVERVILHARPRGPLWCHAALRAGGEESREFFTADWHAREADLIFEIPSTEAGQTSQALVGILIEHQSGEDPVMPLRLLYFVVL